MPTPIVTNTRPYSPPTSLWVALVALLLLMGSLVTYFTESYQDRLTTELYRDARYELAANAAALSSAIGSRILLTNGIKAFTVNELAHNGKIDPSRFNTFSSNFIDRIKGIRNVSIYPDGIARYVYPLKNNEALVGVNLFTHRNPFIRGNAERTRLTDEITILGPLELTQGGIGFLSRQSIFQGSKFWGFVSIVLDASPIMEEADLYNQNKGIDIAVRANNLVLLGDPKLFESPELIERVYLPEGFWEIAAEPKSAKLNSIQSKIRVIQTICASFVLLAIYFVYVQLTQKAKLRSLVQDRTMHLEQAKDELNHQLKLLESKEQALRHMAYHDAITGLYNRTYFNEHLTIQIDESAAANQPFAILFLDLDYFKMINDSIGHTNGDILLGEVARRLTGAITNGQTISRIGGDEFTIIVPEISDREQVKEVAMRVHELFQHPFILKGTEYFISPSIGVALFPEHGQDVTTLIRNADLAMYRAKEEGKNQYRFYDNTFNLDAQETMDIKNSLLRAIEQDEFFVYYQPQIEVNTGKIVGLEALIRWYHPKRGLIPPNSFIQIAEDTGLIVPIGERVLQIVCAQSKAWRQAGISPIRIAVNLSVRQFSQQDLARRIRRILDDNQLEPHDIELEITENMAMKDDMQASLQELKDMGFTISIDDFGTQYSSLGYLKRLPIHKIKIDRSFVIGISRDRKDEAIIMAMLNIADRLNLTVIAEGVETAEQLTFLQDNNCHEIQGFIFYKPLPADQIETLLIQQE
ncbi:EAL domain-containing protein [Cohnella soli]|uniref:EAL domain-containing protein n=1 Tax=Cohnella soli TaxID=425005 RepID=A0ABW0HP81_9BACL